MNKKYYIDIHNKVVLSNNRYNATTKVRMDGQRIAESMGYKSLIFHNYSLQIGSDASQIMRLCAKLFNRIEKIRMSLRLLTLAKLRGDVLFFQYPFLNKTLTSYFRLFKYRRCKTIVLFIDIDTFRFGEKDDISFMEKVDLAIIHTEEMEKKCRESGLKIPLVQNHFFDYLTNYKRDVKVDTKNLKIIFAGNFSKSLFVRSLDDIPLKDGSFYLYGLKTPDIHETNKVQYKGVFNSDDIDIIEGNWSLVWDGPDINTCTGQYGEYLRYNAPFKFSLSLALGLPIIVWKESAMARFVEDYHLGICVDSLFDINDVISHLSDKEKDNIAAGLDCYSQKVRAGLMLKNALSRAESLLEIEKN